MATAALQGVTTQFATLGRMVFQEGRTQFTHLISREGRAEVIEGIQDGLVSFQERVDRLGVAYLHAQGRLATLMLASFATSVFAVNLIPPASKIYPLSLLKISHQVLTTPTVILGRTLYTIIRWPFEKVDLIFKVEFSLGTGIPRGVFIPYEYLVAMSVAEEAIFRGLIQTVLLTELPKLILRKFAPAHENLVDHKIAVAARIIFTSFLFSLCHASIMGSARGAMVPQFVAGCLFSLWREKGANLAELSFVHFCLNAIFINGLGRLVAKKGL